MWYRSWARTIRGGGYRIPEFLDWSMTPSIVSKKYAVRAGGELHSDKYRAYIDGIRAIAVSSVVVSHAFPKALPGGFVGVDIFFVISGYLISLILMRDFQRNSFSIWHFYNRRVRRIFPALVVTLLFIVMFGWFCLFSPEFIALGRHISGATLFSENFLLWNETGYFDVASTLKPTLHLWSLAIEEQFYILWPMLLYVAYRRRINFALLFVVLAGVSFAINLYEIHADPAAAYYSPFGRSWELMVGACLAYIQTSHPSLLARHGNFRSWAGLALIVLGIAFIRPENPFPGFWALLPTFGSALLISGGEEAWASRHILSTAPMVWCGLISYPLYLWHWPFLSFGLIIFGALFIKKTLVCLFAAIVAATLTFLFIERPFRVQKSGRKKTVGLIAGMTSILACGVLISTHAVAARLNRFDLPTRNEFDFLKERTPGFDEANSRRIYHLGSERPESVLFIGDSHIAQYTARLDKVIESDPRLPGATLAIGGGCIPIERVTDGTPMFAKCWPLRDEAYKMSEQSKFKTVVIGGAWNIYFLLADYVYNDGGRQIELTSPQGRAAAMLRLQQRIKKLVRSGKRVIFLLDNPNSDSFNPAGQANRLDFTSKNFRSNSTAKIDAREIKLNQELYDLAKGAGARVIDPEGAVCVGMICRTTTANGQPLYRDYNHFNPDWVIDHANFIDSTLE